MPGKGFSKCKNRTYSTKFAEKFDSIKILIPRTINIRWNSQFATVERILTIPFVESNEISTLLKYIHICLTTSDISMLQEFIGLLSLFSEATVVTYNNTTLDLSDI